MVSDWLPQRIAQVWEARPKGMRQKDLEANIGLGRGAFWNWREDKESLRAKGKEEEPVLPPIDRLEAFATAIGGQFILEIVPPGEDKRELVPLDPATAELAREVVALPPDERAWLLRLVRVYKRLDQYLPMLHMIVTQTEARVEDARG